ncbi:MAG: TetR/AcrR family transcriptional regulator [Deferribacterales bacterium]
MNTKDKIYNTAVEMFGRYGYQGVRIDALVKKAKVNKTTFYYYFESKQEIFDQVMRESLNYFKDKLTEGLKGCETADEVTTAMLDIMFSRDIKDVQLFTREILEGGENLSDELYGIMVEVVNIQTAVLSRCNVQDPSFIIYLLVGVSNFYLSLGVFKQSWMKRSLEYNANSVVNFDETYLKAKIKSVIMKEFSCQGE